MSRGSPAPQYVRASDANALCRVRIALRVLCLFVYYFHEANIAIMISSFDASAVSLFGWRRWSSGKERNRALRIAVMVFCCFSATSFQQVLQTLLLSLVLYFLRAAIQ
mmetsp:Transcript_14492/g.34958  ORF Transcript_14492/g.34958 Transcript_14492/m.34958 type:complete len:108 (+) Transcript_14492:2105-2428(+)